MKGIIYAIRKVLAWGVLSLLATACGMQSLSSKIKRSQGAYLLEKDKELEEEGVTVIVSKNDYPAEFKRRAREEVFEYCGFQLDPQALAQDTLYIIEHQSVVTPYISGWVRFKDKSCSYTGDLMKGKIKFQHETVIDSTVTSQFLNSNYSHLIEENKYVLDGGTYMGTRVYYKNDTLQMQHVTW